MKKPQHKYFAHRLVAFLSCAMALFCSSCAILGVMGSPTSHERKIPAEYNLGAHKSQRILILVDQPGWLIAPANLRFHLTDAMTKELTKKLKLASERFVAYDELSKFRSGRSDFTLLSPDEVGRALGADLILLVAIEDCQLNEMAETGYCKGFLSTCDILIEAAGGNRLWPKSEDSKDIKVGFDVESRGLEIAVRRLAAACAHCTVRYFYNCPKDKFKISDDRSNVSWGEWGK